MIRSALRRPILFACAILAVAAAAAGMRVNQWSPVDAFLEHRALSQSDEVSLTADGRVGGPQAAAQSAYGHYSPEAIAPGGFATGTAGKAASGHASANWGFSSDRLQGAASAGISERAASLGGLWRLMGLTHAHGGVAASSHAASAAPKAPKAPKAPHHSAPSTHPNPEVVLAQVTTPAILIGNNPPSVSGLIAGTGGQPGAFTPGGTPHLGGGGGSLSTTPEPASMLLMGTGLLGLAAMLRRRRA